MMLSEMGWAMAVEGATDASVFEAYIEHFMVLIRARRQDLRFPTYTVESTSGPKAIARDTFRWSF